ncbi:MAG: FAD-dependent oxidoreductase [Bacteroidetes bacterium]|nr:FAD-dependent oxidoreductase [Bacteroidota bacterium]
MEEKQYDVIVLGGGPAGLTAGIYLARAKARALIIDTGTIGGQTVLTYEVANYPGVEMISGYQLSSTMRKQAQSFGCDIISNVSVTNMDLDNKLKSVVVNGKQKYTAKSVILATGGKSRTLNVPGEADFKGKGISYCATCDGDFFQDKEIVVVGGGNSALEEADSLTKYASKVTVLHEFDHFQALQHAVEKAKSNPKIEFIMNSHITEFSGDQKLTHLVYKDLVTGTSTEKAIDGVFIFIGYVANTQKLIDTSVKLNNRGEIITDEDLQTNIEGVYAAGDNRAVKYRQITTAVADGTVAALNALEFLNS